MTTFLRRLLTRQTPPAAGVWTPSMRWPIIPSSPNATPANDLASRARAEQEVRNNALAKRIVSAWSAALVGGSGLTPMLTDPDLRRRWDAWAALPDAAGRLDWVALLQQIAETVITSGECFVLLQVSEDAPEIPLSLLRRVRRDGFYLRWQASSVDRNCRWQYLREYFRCMEAISGGFPCYG